MPWAAQGTKILINSNYRNALELLSVFLTHFSNKKKEGNSGYWIEFLFIFPWVWGKFWGVWPVPKHLKDFLLKGGIQMHTGVCKHFEYLQKVYNIMVEELIC